MLFIPIKFKTYVQLMPIELDSRYQERIYEKLRFAYEGTCTKFGYIKPQSIEIVKRSCGNFVKQNFNGAIRFDVICRGEVCNPIQGSIVSALIKNKNELGILAESTMELENETIPILDIIIPIKSAGIISEIDLDKLFIGDTINVEVMGKKYQMKDKKISIIGRVIKRTNEFVAEGDVLEEDLEEDENDEDYSGEVEDLLSSEEEDDEEDNPKKKALSGDLEEEEEEEEDSENESEVNEFEEENVSDIDDYEDGGDDNAFDAGVDDY
jgi:DNA-directed RNA polymerase subunit E'/Rpb7